MTDRLKIALVISPKNLRSGDAFIANGFGGQIGGVFLFQRSYQEGGVEFHQCVRLTGEEKGEIYHLHSAKSPLIISVVGSRGIAETLNFFPRDA